MRGARRALLSVASLCLAASAALAADPYAEYRIPEHRWLAWTASANAGGLHRSSSGYFGTSYTDGQLNASASSSLTGGFDSDATSHAYFLTLEFAADRARSTDHEEFPSILDQDETRRTASQFAEAFLAWSRYPHAVPIGLSLGTAGSFGLGQTWDSNQAHEVTPPSATRSQSSGSQGSYVANASLTASLSLGRVRDATPVYQAQVLEQRLREAGTITRELSPAARERLASLYTIEHDLSFAHQRPTKYFWRELERLLREDGVLGEGGLDAYSVQKLLEPLTIVGSGAVARARGLAIGPQVALQKYWTHRSLDASGSSSYYQSDTLVDVIQYSADHSTDSQNDRILSGMFADFHLPAGMRWQIDASSLATITEEGKEIDWASRTRVNWLVADRWYAVAGVQHSLAAFGHGADRHAERWDVSYTASMNYFLEDAWSLGLGWSGGQSQGYGYDRRDTFSLGVTYQLSGWLSAPAVFAPMRLTPPAN